jgi:hypothetical protein
MNPSPPVESLDAPPARQLSIVGLMIAIAVAVLGIVFVLALLDMRGGGAPPRPAGAAQGAQAGAKAASPP